MYIFPHNKKWASEYSGERDKILEAFGEGLQLFHIGSTAIEGLYAKDCIDILGVVKDLALIPEKAASLEGLGYLYKGSYGIQGREYFSKSSRKVHLHMFQEGHPEIAKHQHFVEEMRSNPKLVAQLNALKIHLHNKYPADKDRYQQEKADFYNQIHEKL